MRIGLIYVFDESLKHVSTARLPERLLLSALRIPVITRRPRPPRSLYNSQHHRRGYRNRNDDQSTEAEIGRGICDPMFGI